MIGLERWYTLCDSGVCEDVVHFLVVCGKFEWTGSRDRHKLCFSSVLLRYAPMLDTVLHNTTYFATKRNLMLIILKFARF